MLGITWRAVGQKHTSSTSAAQEWWMLRHRLELVQIEASETHRNVHVESLAPSGHSTNTLLVVTRHLLEQAESLKTCSPIVSIITVMPTFWSNGYCANVIRRLKMLCLLFIFFFCPLFIVVRKAKKLLSLKHHSTFKGGRKHNKWKSSHSVPHLEKVLFK